MLGLFSGGLRGGEIIVILAILLVLFGAKRLPEMGKGLGKGLREFKEGLKATQDDVKEGLEDTDRTSERPKTE